MEFSKKNHEKDNKLFGNQWGKLIRIIFEDLPKNYTQYLIAMANSNNENEFNFTIKIIRSLTKEYKKFKNLRLIIRQIILNPLFKLENIELENLENNISKNTKYYNEIQDLLTNFNEFLGAF
jgi:hypothetical protein